MFKKCPYCNTNITSIRIKTIPAYNEQNTEWKWIAYTCSNYNCNAILSVWIDPVALKTDTVNEIIKKIKWI